ncbi:hypothetical protein ACS0TY_029535 [Phlomoides rotata]
MFEAARKIMSWLGECEKIIASKNEPVCWTTPLGLPVVQPYRKTARHLVLCVHTSSRRALRSFFTAEVSCTVCRGQCGGKCCESFSESCRNLDYKGSSLLI